MYKNFLKTTKWTEIIVFYAVSLGLLHHGMLQGLEATSIIVQKSQVVGSNQWFHIEIQVNHIIQNRDFTKISQPQSQTQHSRLT
jgi:hypothetical protein